MHAPIRRASEARSSVEYPEADDMPMAETDAHRELLFYLIDALRRRFGDDPAFYASGNLFVYYEEGNPQAVVAPDVFAVRGVTAGDRRTYKVWDEGKGPDVVIELTSRSTHLEDLGNKRAIYEAIGVKEYFIFDPDGQQLEPPLRAFRRVAGALQPVEPMRREDGTSIVASETLALELHGRGNALRWVDPRTGTPLPGSRDLARSLGEAEAEVRRLRAELARRHPGPP